MVSALLSGLCHFTGVAIASRRKIRLRRSATWLTVACAGGMAAMGLLIWAALTGRMPNSTAWTGSHLQFHAPSMMERLCRNPDLADPSPGSRGKRGRAYEPGLWDRVDAAGRGWYGMNWPDGSADSVRSLRKPGTKPTANSVNFGNSWVIGRDVSTVGLPSQVFVK